jgi:hypothetical protein
MLPTFVIYTLDTGYNGKVSDAQRIYAISTLGNLGHVGSSCIHQFISVDYEMHPKCSKGKLSRITYTGLIPDIHDP